MFKYLLAALLSVAQPALADGIPWLRTTEIYINPDNSKAPVVLFGNSYTNTYQPMANRGAWTSVDVTSLGIPVDAKWMFVSGILIITHGSNPEVCNLMLNFRAPGSTLAGGNYIGQTIEAQVGGGQRSNMSTIVPLSNGKFEFYWSTSTFGSWPDWCSYGWNLSLQAWGR